MNHPDTNSDDSSAELIPDIRTTARAIFIRGQHILLLRKDYGEYGERFALPGGGQEPGETLHQALQRECEEEIGSRVSIGPLLHVADFFKLRETDPPTVRHVLDMLFHCEVPEDYIPHNGPHPDKHQVEVVWAELARLPDMPLFPPYLPACIARLDDQAQAVYLGRV